MQDAFVAMHGRWRPAARPRPGARPTCAQTVVNRSRSVLRHRARRRAGTSPRAACRDAPGADDARRSTSDRRRAVLDALRALPDRQREVLALRYYLDLSEAEIAETLGISRGAVKSHASRGAAALRHLLEDHR